MGANVNLTKTMLLVGFAATVSLLNSLAAASSSATPFADNRSHAVFFVRPFFDIMDCNSEGAIDTSEVDDHFHQIFFSHDRDRSKSISLSEFALFSPDRAKSLYLFERIDKNFDKMLTAKEYRQHMIAAIKLADRDGDGELSRQEVGLPVKNAPKMRVLPGYKLKTSATANMQ